MVEGTMLYSYTSARMYVLYNALTPFLFTLVIVGKYDVNEKVLVTELQVRLRQ